MRILVLANTPAHVHTYRHAVDRLEERGHEVLVLGREYACTTALLDYFELPYEVYGTHAAAATSRLAFGRQVAGQFVGVARRAARFDPDVVFGRGQYAALAGTIARAPTVLVLDDEPSGFNHRVSAPFADAILSPAATRRDFGDRHYAFDGFKECAYLHPEVFERSEDVRDRLGVDPDERFAIVRLNAWDALHDVGARGFTRAQRRELLQRLGREATVFVSDEGGETDLETLPAKPYDLHPALIHDAMAEADLLVADTGTMVTEAGLLGTPAVRYGGTDGHEFGEFAALEEAGLVDDCRSYDRTRDRALELLADGEAKVRRRRRRDEYVGGLVNLADLLVDVAEARGAMEAVDRDRSSVRRRSGWPT